MFKRASDPIFLICLIIALVFTSSTCKKTEVAKLEATDFTSEFDQGNIRNVTKIAENEFSMEVDPKELYGKDNPSWYYFKINQNAKDKLSLSRSKIPVILNLFIPMIKPIGIESLMLALRIKTMF